MTRKKDAEIIRKEDRKRKSETIFGQVTSLLKKLTAHELVKIMKDIKHIHIKNAIKTKEVKKDVIPERKHSMEQK